MNIWIVCVGEPLPTDEGGQRPLRAGMLTDALLSRGHQVTWWTSTFNHSSKRHRAARNQEVTSPNGARLWLLHGVGYKRNIGLSRLLNHMQLARQFTRLAPGERPPDLIFCCWPVMELAAAVLNYAEPRSIPTILDVRDLWPDIFLEAIPRAARPLAKIVLAPYERLTRAAFRRASGVVGISQGYLNWGLARANRGMTSSDAVFPLGYPEPDWSRVSPAAGRKYLQALGVDDSRLVCWFLGTFGDTYDLEPVIHAARLLQERGLTQYQFVLSGEGEWRESYEKLAAGLKNIVFTGWLNADGIASMMRVARVAIAAYRKGAPQGLPNKIFEYMAAGLPILSSLEGECRLFLDENECGLSYPPGSTAGFFNALMSLTENEKLAGDLGAKALSAFRQRYSARIIYPQIIEHIAGMVGPADEVTFGVSGNIRTHENKRPFHV